MACNLQEHPEMTDAYNRKLCEQDMRHQEATSFCKPTQHAMQLNETSYEATRNTFWDCKHSVRENTLHLVLFSKRSRRRAQSMNNNSDCILHLIPCVMQHANASANATCKDWQLLSNF